VNTPPERPEAAFVGLPNLVVGNFTDGSEML
jgi:hypothetical protein